MTVKITGDDSAVRVTSDHYRWEWRAEDDQVRLHDARGRLIVAGALQPAVLVKPAESQHPRCSPGRPFLREIGHETVSIEYLSVNGTARLRVTWRFDLSGLWLEPIIYETSRADDIISLNYFAEARADAPDAPRPTLHASHYVIPGVCESCCISPVVPAAIDLDATICLGAGATHGQGVLQQWGLPSHFFCGFHRNARHNAAGALTDHLSYAFCVGLADLPNGDFLLRIQNGCVSPLVNVRSDLWGHARGPGSLVLGARLTVTVGPTYHEAIRSYYRRLLDAGIIQAKAATTSTVKARAVLAPQFNTWGAQVAMGLQPEAFDEQVLDSIYGGFQSSGMAAKMVVIDDKWEGSYGVLQHSEERFPRFDAMLQRFRDDGYLIGIWAAFLRCEDPAAVGLTTAHMLRCVDGTPLQLGLGSRYFLFDVTQPEVQQVLGETARRFIRRYRPDLVKFDFGYELPMVDTAVPSDRSWAGERLLRKALDVVVGPMKDEHPDLVVMYYGLSPLMADAYDLHSVDDLFLCEQEYDLEANRRMFFSGLCGEFGMPTYGSSGYDWETAPNVWFDSAVVGTVGSLNAFAGDEAGTAPHPRAVAKYNGVVHALRPRCTFSIQPLDANYVGAARGATASSWARMEQDRVVMIALRRHRLTGGHGIRSYGDVVWSDASVIVASMSDEAIERATDLAVVPFGDGELRLRHAAAGPLQARVTSHLLGGGTDHYQIPIVDGWLRVPLQERRDDGEYVEWLHLSIVG